MDKNIKYYTALLLFSTLSVSCEKELATSQATIESEFFSSDGNISRMYLSPGAEDNSAGGYIDIATGTLYTSGNIADYYHEIDLAYMYNASTGNNLLAMDAQNISSTPLGEEIEHLFPYKNKGILHRFTGVTEADKNWFQSLSSSADIQRGYDSLLNVLTLRGGNEAQGKKRLANLQRGEMVLFQSVNRNIKSMIYIDALATSTTGQMSMIVKSDAGEQLHFQKPELPLNNLLLRADTLVLRSSAANTDENYIDLLRRKVYKYVDLENDDLSQITLVHTYGLHTGTATPITMFYNLTSSAHLPKYSAPLWDWMNGVPNRRNIRFYRSDNQVSYVPGYTFEDVRNNNHALKEYGEFMFSRVAPWTSRIPGSDNITATAGMVFLIEDRDLEMWGVMKVLSVDNANGMCTVAYKYYENEEI